MHTPKPTTDDPLQVAQLPDTTEPAVDNSAYEFPPGYLAKAEKIIQGAHAASADPLPGPLLDAFLPEPLVAAGFTLRPVVPSDFAILKRIDSPLLQELKNANLDPELPKPVVHYAEEDVWELLYLFTNPPPKLRAVLAQGRPAYREAAMSIADNLPLTVIKQGQDIMRAIVGNVLRSFATKVNHQASSTGDGGNFPKGQPGTASAGGSIT